MTWNWRYEVDHGGEVAVEPPAAGFPSQSDAESWIGEAWPELLAAGVDAVTLFEEGRKVYGPMSLHADR